ncbi:MAG: DUF3524 domain-containing protein [Bacteroidota bacterium]
MKILLVEAFYGGSHQLWADALQKHSQHEVEILHLPARHWKWRMHGGAIELSKQWRESGFEPEVILITDMIDLNLFISLSRSWYKEVPIVLYMHENQITYPWSPEDEDVPQRRDRHYGFINYASALAADEVWFNSRYHKQSFLAELPHFLRVFPDYRDLNSVKEIQRKSQVMNVGITPPPFTGSSKSQKQLPTLVWNHRWEYDKGPEPFFKALFELADQGLAFELIVLGEAYGRKPEIFAEAKERLGERILHWGFAESRTDYWDLLQRADIAPTTAWHDFFGISVVEAMAAGCYPLLPKRLAYPEHVPAECLYEDDSFGERLADLIQRIDWVREQNPKEWVNKYHWAELAPQYDRRLAMVATGDNLEWGDFKNWH